MFSETSTIISAELQPSGSTNNLAPESGKPRSPWKTGLLILGLALTVLILGLALFLIFQKYFLSGQVKTKPKPSATSTVQTATSTPNLPNLELPGQASTTALNLDFSSSTVEYLSFANFYQAPDNKFTAKITDYTLPLNVKIDVLNYYDVSRKLNLDTSLDRLNNQGFAIIDNPWSKQAIDFASIYSNLNNQQIPLLVTSDFIIYEYQNVYKKVFKEIEEGIFYDNLWEINQKLYTTAKTRYEARLAAIGNVNDPILEGERLETVYFAVALELMKPNPNQITNQPGVDQNTAFTPGEADHFYFVTPTYLRDDVTAELKLIRAASAVKTKSPILLYQRNYTDFIVPADYRNKAKLNNFYLANRWLNSVFPLNYQSQACPNCLLDKADWRISLTAASLMAQDFSVLPELKNKWARIYKVTSFFKGLREELSYLHYRDSLTNLFGADYQIEDLFSDQNKDAVSNLEKLRTKLAGYDFSELAGALAKNDPNFKQQQGLRVLADSYYPNDYIFSRLLAPVVGNYLGTSTKPTTVSSCSTRSQGVFSRCAGIALDAVNLVYPINGQAYFSDNTNYSNYNSAALHLAGDLNQADLWHSSNYWTNLKLIQAYLNRSKVDLPLFAQSPAWTDKALQTAASAWINLQLPADQIGWGQSKTGGGLGASLINDNSYIEPNLNLVNELLANNEMLIKMFSALQLNIEVRLALQDVQTLSDNLSVLKSLIAKELTGQVLTVDDNKAVAAFIGQLQVKAPGGKQLFLRFPNQAVAQKEDLSHLQLLVLTHQSGNNKVFSVGPVWTYQENH
jgi:hypothetical protein